MEIGAFSEFRTNPVYRNNSFIRTDNQDKKSEKKEKLVKTAKSVAPIAISIAAIPVTALIATKITTKKVSSLNNNLVSELKGQIKNLSDDLARMQALAEQRGILSTENIQTVANNAKSENAKIWSVLLALAGLGTAYKAGDLSDDVKKDLPKKVSDKVSDIDSKSSQAMSTAEQAMALSGNSLSKKYVVDINGIQLLRNSNSLNKNEQKYAQAIEKIQTSAPKHLYETPNVKAITKGNPTLWSVTSEFAPIKEGGLGSVPVEIQNNVTKLGINIPTFIPMYQQRGIASLRQEGSEYIYSYKGKDFKLEKVASFNVDAYQNSKSKTEEVEIYLSTTKDESGREKQLVFIKNDNYFNGSIYQASEKTEEPEKFAFFSKAVYEFAKAKEDPKSVKGLKIFDSKVFNSIQAPDGLVLNDWQASPIAALSRYKAPMENAYGELSDDAAKKLSEITIITIGHNAMYQGSTRNNNNDAQRKESTTNILNTLFDNYAYDIVLNAKTNATATNPSDSGLENLDNVLIMNQKDGYSNHTNLLNMGICLSDYFHPVSQNYANEIISDSHPELAGELRWALNQKAKSGSLVGIINGNDFNNLSIEAKKSQILQQTGVEPLTYNKTSDISDVMAARLENKINFYNDYMLPFSHKNDKSNFDENVERVRKLSSKLEFVEGNKGTELPVLSDEELATTPVITSVGRLVSQKGIGIMSDAIKLLLDNWEKDFPGRNKPIFYIAGQDGENGTQRKYIEDLKNNKLTKEDSNRVVFAHGFAPMSALTAASDFFLLPSIFEPCGLTQGESFALGTPVIGSAVGGIVDTVNRDGKTNGILTDKTKPLTSEDFYKAMKEGLKIYFENPQQYEKMVKDSLSENFSWIQKGKQGPVFDYLEKLGIDKSPLPEIM